MLGILVGDLQKARIEKTDNVEENWVKAVIQDTLTATKKTERKPRRMNSSR